MRWLDGVTDSMDVESIAFGQKGVALRGKVKTRYLEKMSYRQCGI